MERSAPKRVAFFGGSFDPPHCGHLAIARAAATALALDSVLFAPVGAQPLKPQGSTADFSDRVAMTRLAVAAEPAFAVSLVDAPKPDAAPNYTIDTLLRLRSGLGRESALHFLMGADSFLAISRWHRANELPFAAALVIASRPGQPLDDLRTALPHGLTIVADEPSRGQEPASPAQALDRYIVRNPAGQVAPLFILHGLHFDVSASQIRDEIRGQMHGQTSLASAQDRLLAAPVMDYIRAHHLYQSA